MVFFSVDSNKNICDSFDLYKCEHCYECRESSDLYKSFYCVDSHNSNNLYYCKNCKGCNNCFGSTNLVNKQFYIYNKSYTKEEYNKKLSILLTQENLNKISHNISITQDPFVKYSNIIQSECCTGDNLSQCKYCHNCYILKNSENCSQVQIGDNNKDSYDCNFSDNSELQYYSSNLEKNYQILFSILIWYCTDVTYSLNCFNSNNLFESVINYV